MRHATLALPLAALAALAACGSDGGGDGDGGGSARLTATGALPLEADAFTSVVQATSCPVPELGGVEVGVAFAAVGASDQPGMCGYLQRGEVKQSASSILVVAVQVNPLGAAALTPDTYPVVGEVTSAQTRYAFVQVNRTDLACSSQDEVATGGTVEVTDVGGGRVRGTVNATLPGGGTVTGSFDAPACDVDLLAQSDVCGGQIGPAAPTCAP